MPTSSGGQLLSASPGITVPHQSVLESPPLGCDGCAGSGLLGCAGSGLLGCAGSGLDGCAGAGAAGSGLLGCTGVVGADGVTGATGVWLEGVTAAELLPEPLLV